MRGATEWVRDPVRPGLADRSLADLLAVYNAETGMEPYIGIPRPNGESGDAGFNPETLVIAVFDVAPAGFRDGYLAEELHHYVQIRDLGYLRTAMEVIEVSHPGIRRYLERDVIARVRASGFIPYDHRNYEPYTDVPRPPGVAGG